MADLRVKVVRRKDDGAVRDTPSLEFEVIVQSDAEQIKAKPPHVYFCTPTQRAADLIQRVTGRKALLLGDVAAPADSDAIVESALRRNERRARRLEVEKHFCDLERHTRSINPLMDRIYALLKDRGPLTADAVAALLGRRKWRPHASAGLTRLAELGLVRSKDVPPLSGRPGRPMRLFALADVDLWDLGCRHQCLANSQEIASAAGDDPRSPKRRGSGNRN